MIYTIKENTSKRSIVLLHGSGGDEYDLMEIGQLIDPDATLIGIRGDVQEHGMNRYFKKNIDGTFDEANLKEETEKLYQQIKSLHHSNDFITVLGYSNGANIAQNILKENDPGYDLVLLLHPSLVRAEVSFKRLNHTNVFLSTGMQDPYLPLVQFEYLKDQLQQADIPYETYLSQQGHQITKEELAAMKQWYLNQIKK